MALPVIVGHQAARARLAEALRSGRLPQVLSISGPPGVGKQRLALWLAQLALCERRELEPCGRCRPCRLVDGLAHADLHWFVPIPRPKAADPDKAVDEAAQAIAEVMDERRARPLYGQTDGMASHSMASVRLAASPGVAHVGRRRAAGLHPGRRRAAGAAGVESGGGQRAPQAARGATGRRAVHPDDGGPAEPAPDHPVARGAGAAQPADGRRGAGVPEGAASTPRSIAARSRSA